tara:strand:+ start:3116 stop:3526 length:411 start_codon:yes stop_codon:yes gene_type:complete
MGLPAIPAALGGLTAAAKGAQMARGAGMAAGGIGGLARMAEGGPMFMRNEPNIFSIDAEISNLMDEYDMVVRNIPFAETIEEKQMAEMRAQNVANEIDQLQQQKIAIQAQNVPSNMNLANPQRSEIDSILNKISIR